MPNTNFLGSSHFQCGSSNWLIWTKQTPNETQINGLRLLSVFPQKYRERYIFLWVSPKNGDYSAILGLSKVPNFVSYFWKVTDFSIIMKKCIQSYQNQTFPKIWDKIWQFWLLCITALIPFCLKSAFLTLQKWRWSFREWRRPWGRYEKFDFGDLFDSRGRAAAA